MSNYIIREGELYHYGVPGMKWGVRRAKRYERISSMSRRASDMYKGLAEDARKQDRQFDTRKYTNTAKFYEHRADKYAKRADKVKATMDAKTNMSELERYKASQRTKNVVKGVVTTAGVGAAAIAVAPAAYIGWEILSRILDL